MALSATIVTERCRRVNWTLACLLLACLAVSGQARAQTAQAKQPTEEPRRASGAPMPPEQAAIDVTRYDLTLRVNPADRSIAGAAVVDARIVQPTIWFVLDLDTRLTVDRVTEVTAAGAPIPGSPRAVERRGGRIWAEFPLMRQPGERVRVRVAYHGKPKVAPRPPWDDGFVWSHTPDGKPWVGVACESDGADVWWPCKDQPSDRASSMALHITVPDPLVCAASGHQTGFRENHDGTRTYDWAVSTPINNYAMSINIAPYRAIHTTYTSTAAGSVPVYFYALPQHYAQAKALTTKFLRMVRFLEEKCGPYPFRADKIGVAETPYLGMEHQTITAYGNDFRDNEYGFDWLLFHEFAHEWFANLVTNADWKDMWLHEGFASYLEALYAEALKGEAGYRGYMEGFRRQIVNRRPVASRETQDSVQVYVDNDIYMKGAWALGTLRYLIGDKAFFTALRRMAYPDPAMERVTDGRQCRYATTDDFLTIAERASGRKLGWFFEVYLRQPKLPKLVQEQADGKLTLRWDVPDDLPFPMPVDVKIGGTTRRVNIPRAGATLTIPAGAAVKVDPLDRVLKAE